MTSRPVETWAEARYVIRYYVVTYWIDPVVRNIGLCLTTPDFAHRCYTTYLKCLVIMIGDDPGDMKEKVDG